jgi:predicted adenine nucleotide alpha hydrolase (AANH) superfamily ATPase
VDADYNHEAWKAQTWNLRNEPERGERCFYCFKIRLVERQAAIVRQYDFYRQQYCGCEYSFRDSNKWRKEKGEELIKPLQKHE